MSNDRYQKIPGSNPGQDWSCLVGPMARRLTTDFAMEEFLLCELSPAITFKLPALFDIMNRDL